MNAVEIQQAGMQSTVGRDCRERLPTRRANDWIAEKRSPVICVARSRVCRDGRGMKGCPSCVNSTRVASRYTRTGRNWTARGHKCRALDANCEMGLRSLPVFRPRFVVPGIRRVNPSCVDELAPF